MIKVFVSGCYDILHAGHVHFFTQAKALGDYLIVSVAGDEALAAHKHRRPSLPVAHKTRLLASLRMVDEVVVGEDLEEPGLDYKSHFLRIQPGVLAVTEDDRFAEAKRSLCRRTGACYVVLPKVTDLEKISTSGIIRNLRVPDELPLRVDFAGGWLDVPEFARAGGYIVNCAVSPCVSLHRWPYRQGSGLGGSAAYAILCGRDGVEAELGMGVGWQDPAVILETGLCVWRSGASPVLDFKVNPGFVAGRMALFWTGKDRRSAEQASRLRNYDKIVEAGARARAAANPLCPSYDALCDAVRLSYEIQLEEGMAELPAFGEVAKKYGGGGFGGYGLYLFRDSRDRDAFVGVASGVPVEPYSR